jgi:hypothetical protein
MAICAWADVVVEVCCEVCAADFDYVFYESVDTYPSLRVECADQIRKLVERRRIEGRLGVMECPKCGAIQSWMRGDIHRAMARSGITLVACLLLTGAATAALHSMGATLEMHPVAAFPLLGGLAVVLAIGLSRLARDFAKARRQRALLKRRLKTGARASSGPKNVWAENFLYEEYEDDPDSTAYRPRPRRPSPRAWSSACSNSLPADRHPEE